ncbi:protein Shroom4 isoform X2 [Vidua macroura]|uniref:protein Shroom4 isoform X2 n=1 Tax=Vidua macroura TaxID=187451 RepID=UPI0023A8AF37|nr:protein Shroom4 isoform X2 [Vidua macroura]
MERAEGRPGAPQYVHVQLQGGAPWGFTLRGGLEHGEPLIVSKVEDGGKAALSRRLQPGDELVNISGTPLYGSRQEALILIKGSYRTLKMVVRRRNVPVFRPHSWHVAKLAESRPDVPTMNCPADAFSLSWPSGCDVSTDRSSSIGSMESLDHPSQACYEGDPSPVDQGMYHSKRDSAYSSFSASSIASDCALSLRPEEAVSIDSSLQGPCKASDRRYLTTGAEPSASWHPEAWRAPVPPLPPVRRDSLRAAPAGRGDRRQASVSVDMLHAKGRWISDTFLCQRDGEAEVVGRRKLAPYPTKDCLSADQYYMLSSQTDRCPAESLLGESIESDNQPYLDDSMHRVPDATTAGDNPLLSPLKGHMSHRHSAPEQLLASQFRSLQLGTSSGRASPAPSGQRWTLSPLHPEGSRGGTTGAAQDPPHCPEPCCRPPPCRCCPELQQACGQDGQGASPVLSTEGPVEESQGGARRAGGPPHRSAQMRRRSDRFATSLRNEIQRRKAQLQKSRGPGAHAPGEEPVEETEEPPEGSVLAERRPALPERLSPAPSEESRNSGRSADRGIPTPDPVPAPKGPLSPERVVPTARGRWRWSPENKLQLQHLPSPSELEGYSQGPAACTSPPRGSDEAVLLPFADRRRFFEESSRVAPPRHSKPPAGDPSTFQPPLPEHRDVRRLSVDQPYSPSSPSRPGSAGPHAECCREQPHCYKPLGRPGELDYLRGFSYPCGVPLRPEPCRCCGGDLCPPPLPRGHTCRCHLVSWVRCPDCCYPATHPGQEDSDAWPPRRAFIPEFPQDEWEPPAITRKVSQSIRASGAREKRTKMKQSWEMEEQPQRLIQNQEQGCASPHGMGECSLSLHCGSGPALPEALKPSSGAVEGVSCQGSWPQPRCMDSEERLWDVAVRDHSLVSVLAPLASPGTATEVMGELLVAGERQAWRKCLQQDWHLEALAQDRQGFEPISLPPRSAASSSSFPVHYGVAVGKTEPLNKVKALPEVMEGSSEDEEEEVDRELVEKKLQLIESLSRKLVVLQEAQRGLQEDISANGALGEDVAARLQALCTPGEFDKYRLFVGDLDKVVNLLLSLSGRLARVETALGSLGPHAPAEDKLALREKQRLLVAQLEDAKELKEHVGRREEAVGAMVARYLPAEHLQDYQHFVKMKSALIAEQRELEEKIKLGQEQLRCLRESLGQASKDC